MCASDTDTCERRIDGASGDGSGGGGVVRGGGGGGGGVNGAHAPKLRQLSEEVAVFVGLCPRAPERIFDAVGVADTVVGWCWCW